MCRPEHCMELEFKTKNPKQLQAARLWMDDVTEQILYGGAKGGGKSFLGAALIFGNALSYPGTHYFIARRELIHLRNFTMPTIAEFFEKVGLDMKRYAPYNGQDHKYTLYNGSVVHLIACDDRPSDPLFERFGSMQITQGWIEEGGEVPEDAKDNLWLAIGRWKNKEYDLPPKLLITANPKKGWMKREFVDLYNEGRLPETLVYIQAFASDNAAYLPDSYEQKLLADKNTVRRQRLAEGNWDYEDDQDALVTYDALSDLFSNTIVKDGERYMIVDVARKGKDSTVISLWDGLELTALHKFTKQITTMTEQRITDLAAVHKIARSLTLVDEDGIGGGVVDHLVGVKGFLGMSVPIKTAYEIRERNNKVAHIAVPKTVFANIKAQCGWKAAELINEHKMSITVPNIREEMIEDLTAILRDRNVDDEGRKLLREKADVKRELRRSPDCGDIVLMRAYFELIKESGIGGLSEAVVKRAVEEQTVRFARRRSERGKNSSE